MDVSAYLRREGFATTQVVFDGERLTAARLRRLRDRILGPG